ncbi:MAG: NADH-quinone oxidoreductase subunit L [Flavobacteriales bacterium]|nr:NADH-quinone oxidoreductase subunit L [Flavobacteriales bacterium]
MGQNILLLTLIALPLVGFVLTGFLGKNLPKRFTVTIATLAVFSSFVCALLLFNMNDKTQIVHLFNVVNFEDFRLSANFQIDSLSIWMTLIITGVGTLIHIFSIGYMSNDEGIFKFFAYLNLFIFSMLLLVLGSNYFVLFFGWEGVGICSYLLIGFHFSDEEKGMENSIAARKAFIMNRIGDIGLLFALFMLLSTFGTLEFTMIADKIHELKDAHVTLPYFAITCITLCLFIAATGKSAQIPLFTWLPDAMAGPTPVSALIHAATMVTAGIYLIVRSNFLFELAPFTQEIILYVGLATSLVAAFIAMRQSDIKKVLAYSTVSQLGLMFVALGMGAYTVALFHVTTHAFFKALLFLGSGSVIHAMSEEQDIRKMGGLAKKIPITHLTFLIGTLAISGFPFLSGFYSKDEILAHALMESPVLYGALMIAVTLTAIYMFRLYFLVFHGKFRGGNELESHVHESGPAMTFPLIVLAILSVFGGILNLPGIFLHDQAHWFSHYLESTTAGLNEIEVHHLESSKAIILMIVASLIALGVMAWAYFNYVKKGNLAKADNELKGWEKASNSKLYIDELYNLLFVKPLELISKTIYSYFDTLVLRNGVFIIAGLIEKTGNVTRKWQSGFLASYLFWMLLSIVGLITYYLIKI